MRIISGQHRGLTLASVGQGDAGAHLRPTSDRVRESLFNLLHNYGLPQGARVLDLFAGTGALGLESLSRGAVFACFVDDGRVAQRLIRENIGKCRREADTRIVTANATKLAAHSGAPFDLVFMDPPYGKGLGQTALACAMAGGWIAAKAMIVWEENAAQSAPQGFTLLDQRRYGDTWITLLEAP